VACLFDDLRKKRRKGPCARCRRRIKPFAARFYEASRPIEWWAAEIKGGGAVYFRVFPPNKHGLPTTPRQRFDGIENEYGMAWEANHAKFADRYRHRPQRGRLWALAATNSEFGRVMARRDVASFRPARACEVMAWLATHMSDLVSAESQEKLIAELETYLPPDAAETVSE